MIDSVARSDAVRKLSIVAILLFLTGAVAADGQSKAYPNIYRNTLVGELGPTLVREDHRIELWLLTATNDYFSRHPNASVNDFQLAFKPAFEFLENRPTSRPMELFVDVAVDLVPHLGPAGGFVKDYLTADVRSNYARVDEAFALGFPNYSVITVLDTLRRSEDCVARAACHAAYDRLLHATGLGSNVETMWKSHVVKRNAYQQRNDGVTIVDDAARFSAKVGSSGKLNAKDAAELKRLQTEYVNEIVGVAKKHREELQRDRAAATNAAALAAKHQRRMDELRAANFLVATFIGFVDPEAGRRIGAAAEGLTKIVDVMGRPNPGNLILAANVTQGVLLFASAMQSGGAGFEQATLSALREIQEQLIQLRIEVQRGFTNLNWKLDAVYAALAHSLAQITSRTVSLETGIVQLQDDYRKLSTKLDQIQVDTADSFRATHELQLAQHAACMAGRKITEAEFENCRSLYKLFVTGTLGRAPYVRTDDPKTAAPPLLQRPIGELVPFLFRYGAGATDAAVAASDTPNLSLWPTYTAMYSSILANYPKFAQSKSARDRIGQELYSLSQMGETVDDSLQSLAARHDPLFRHLFERYAASVSHFQTRLGETFVRTVRIAEDGSGEREVTLRGDEYFSNRLVNGERRPREYSRFGTADQMRGSYELPPRPLVMCPTPDVPRRSNEQLNHLNLNQIIGYDRPFHAMYADTQGSVAQTLDSWRDVVPAPIRMYEDLTGARVGVCISNLNWHGGIDCGFPGEFVFGEVRLTPTLAFYLPAPDGQYKLENVFRSVTVRPSQRTWLFSKSDSCGGHGAHLVHRMHNFAYGTDGKPAIWGEVLPYVTTAPVSNVLHDAVVTRYQGEVERILAERRVVFASAVDELMTERKSRVYGLGGSQPAQLIDSYDEIATSFLLIDRFVTLLLNDSYATDRHGIASAVATLSPRSFLEFLRLIVRERACQVDPSKPCSVRADASVPRDFITQLPRLKETRRDGDVVVFRTAPSHELAGAAKAAVARRFGELPKEQNYEPIVPFEFARAIIRKSQEGYPKLIPVVQRFVAEPRNLGSVALATVIVAIGAGVWLIRRRRARGM